MKTIKTTNNREESENQTNFELDKEFNARLLTRRNKKRILHMQNKGLPDMSEQNKKDLLQVLKEQRKELQRKIDSIDQTIQILEEEFTKNSFFKNTSADDYDPTFTLKSKVLYFIKREQRFLHNREISKMAHEKEPNIPYKDFIKKFSSILSVLKRDGKLTNIIVDDALQNVFWGSPKWLDENGKPKKGFEYNPEMLINNIDREGIEL